MDRHAFRQLLKHNDIAQVQQVCQTRRSIFNPDLDFGYVCKLGYMDLAKWLCQMYIVDYSAVHRAILQVCKKNYYSNTDNPVDTIKWLLTLHDYGDQIIIKSIKAACTYGHSMIFEYLYDIMKTDYNFESNDISSKRLLETASTHGHLHIIQHLLDQDPEAYDHMLATFNNACENGNLDIVVFLVDQKYVNLDIIYGGMLKACSMAHVHVYDWLSYKSPSLYETQVNTLFSVTCQSNMYAVLWFVDKHPGVRMRNQAVAFDKACLDNHLDIAEYLHASMDVTGYNLGKIVESACSKNHPNILKYMSALNDISEYITCKLFASACRSGNIEIAQHLDSLHSNMDVIGDAFMQACKHDNPQVAKWLLDRYPSIDVHIISEMIFLRACSTKHSQITKLLLPYSNEDVSYHILNGYGYMIGKKKLDHHHLHQTIKYMQKGGMHVLYSPHCNQTDILADISAFRKKSAKN